MPGVYRPRHPERTILYRVLFHYFDRFRVEYEDRFQREYGYLRPIIKEVVERYLDCGNPKCGFARIRCPACGEERLLYFSCRTGGFCPSCHSKRLEEWGEWLRETLLLDVSHRQVVFTIPKCKCQGLFLRAIESSLIIVRDERAMLKQMIIEGFNEASLAKTAFNKSLPIPKHLFLFLC